MNRSILWVALFIIGFSTLALWAHRAEAAPSAGAPRAITVATGFPHPAQLSFEYRLQQFLSIGINGGWIGGDIPGIKDPKINASLTDLDARLRWHPLAGAFFFGVGLGYQKISVVGNKTIDITSPASASVPTEFSLDLKSIYATPHLGWLWGWGSSGLVLGFEVGAQCPLKPSTDTNIAVTDPTLGAYLDTVKATTEFQGLQNKVNDGGDKIGKITLPYLAFRIGWAF